MTKIDPSHVSTAAPKPIGAPRAITPITAAAPANPTPHTTVSVGHSHAHGHDDPAGSIADEATRLAVAQIFSKLAQVRRDVMQVVSGPAYQQQLVEHLLKSGSFTEMFQACVAPIFERLNVIEGMLRGIDMGEPEEVTHQNEPAKITGFAARIHDDNNEFTGFQVLIHPANHPTSPNELELYRDEDGTGHWHLCQCSELVEAAVRQAYANAGCQPGQRYWLELQQITDRPINAHSVRVNNAG